MIRSVSIRNFKCLRSVDVELEPLTVLIGENDTGKSSFLEALTFFARTAATGQPAQSFQVTYGSDPNDLSVCAQIDGREFSLQDAKQMRQRAGFGERQNPPLQGVQPPYRLDPDLLRQPAQIGMLEGPLPPKGEQLAAAIDRLPLSCQVKLQEQLRKRVPTVCELILLPVPKSQGFKEIHFDLKSGGRIRAAQASDGVMLLLAYLAIMYDEHAPSLIMVEEPENGIHPKQLEYVVGQLLSLTKKDPPIQVILTTHSPYVLDFVPKESVRVFARTDGGVAVKPFVDDTEIREMLSSGFTLGEAWYNTDENELIRRSGASG